jgi:signal transduction histidine kinase
VGSKLKPRDPSREDLDDVIKELDRIEQIINGLLLFARPPAARPQPCDLHVVLEKTLALLDIQLAMPTSISRVSSRRAAAGLRRPRPGAAGVPQPVPERDPGDAAGRRAGDHDRRAAHARAAPAGGRLVPRQWVGIPKEFMEKIFDPFFTTRSMGTGLGLPISVQIVREVGGTITAKNNAGGGATLRVSIPVPAEPPGRAEE